MTFHLKPVAIAMSLVALLAVPAAADDVTLRYLSDAGGLDASELADQLGYFKGTGITFKDLGFAQGGPQSLFALAGGSVDIGGAATPAVLNAIASGNDFVIAYPSNGINNEVHSSFEVLPGSPIKSIKDLVGKKIAVNTLGAHLDYAIREAFHSAGLPENSAQLVVVP
ncbi:MAG: ABC transporter substrate-binding protein, partial [Devosia sp.]